MESGWWVIICIYTDVFALHEFAAVAVMVFGCYSMFGRLWIPKGGVKGDFALQTFLGAVRNCLVHVWNPQLRFDVPFWIGDYFVYDFGPEILFWKSLHDFMKIWMSIAHFRCVFMENRRFCQKNKVF